MKQLVDTSTSAIANTTIRVGIIGCGEITQVAHIPTLGFLSDFFQITYLCDVSNKALEHCKLKVLGGIPKTTRDAQELCSSIEVDVVFVANSDEYHALHTVLALQHDKFVFVEKPMALNQRDADEIILAEQKSKGKVLVGYMRRYAASFLDAIEEIGGIDKILYARVRDIIGPNSVFVDQSGTFPKKFSDFLPEDTKDKNDRATALISQALLEECGVPFIDGNIGAWRALSGLGSHDLSLMREVLGMPTSVLGASLTFPFWNVLFRYPGFTVSYESGLDDVPRFDAHLEIYGKTKTVRVQYDSPYVKGLPTTIHIKENVNGHYRETMIRKTYEDAYTLEMKELYKVIKEGKEIKTNPMDAKLDLKIFEMILKAGHHKELKITNGLNGTI